LTTPTFDREEALSVDRRSPARSRRPDGRGGPAGFVVFVTAAFPFVVPLVPSTDTQPTFTLFVLLFALATVAQCLSRDVLLPRGGLLLAGVVFGGGVAWLCFSILANGFAASNPNRVASFIMFLIATVTGLLNRRIFSGPRVLTALTAYLFFTILFFLTAGKVESAIIQSRSADMIYQVGTSGRGASTLSPEPSFFAFQVFTIFLLARMNVWSILDYRRRHIIQLITVLLLIASFAGYGILYALMVIFLSGRRYVFGFGLLGAVAVTLIVNVYAIDSLRFVKLFLSIAASLAGGAFELEDVSILVRLTSFQEYWRIFLDRTVFGDAFQFHGGGGLVSLLASLGLYGVLLIVAVVIAISVSRIEGKLKLVLLAWLTLQFISGPIGLPMVGLTIGVLLGRSRLGAMVSAINTLVNRRRGVGTPLASFARPSR